MSRYEGFGSRHRGSTGQIKQKQLESDNINRSQLMIHLQRHLLSVSSATNCLGHTGPPCHHPEEEHRTQAKTGLSSAAGSASNVLSTARPQKDLLSNQFFGLTLSTTSPTHDIVFDFDWGFCFVSMWCLSPHYPPSCRPAAPPRICRLTPDL